MHNDKGDLHLNQCINGVHFVHFQQMLDETSNPGDAAPQAEAEPAPPSQPPANDRLALSRSELDEIVNQAVTRALEGYEDPTSELEEESEEAVALDQTDQPLCGPDINGLLAATIAKRLKERMPAEVLAKKREQYAQVPKNIPSMSATRINDEIWRAIPVHARQRDRR